MNFLNQNDEVVISSSNKKPLMPYAVHTVTLDSVEITESGVYKFLAFSFSNEEGAINLSVFKPNDKDEERKEMSRQNGAKYYLPSRAENMWACFQQLMKTLNPAGYEKAKTVKIKNFDDAFAVVEKVLKAAIGTQTNIKVEGYMKNGYIQFMLPNITTLVDSSNSKSEVRQNDYFVGDQVFLTNYNLTRAAKFKADYEASRNAKPTPMTTAENSTESGDLNITETTSEDLNTNDIDITSLDL